MKRFLTVALCIVPLAANATDETITKPMTFEKCLATIQQTATKLGVAPVNIVETSILRTVRFPASDGSTLVTCSARDSKMVIVRTSSVCGVDIEC